MNVHITLLGKEVLPIYYPIKMFNPDMVYIIGTEQNKELAERLRNLFIKRQKEELEKVKPQVKDCIIIYVDAFDVQATREVCENIHGKYRQQKDVGFMYNLTGGTKIMALAAFGVGQKENAEIIYTDSKKLKYLYPDVFDKPLNCALISDEIFALHGQIFSERELFDPNVMKSTIEAALRVKDFRNDCFYLYSELRECLLKEKEIYGFFPNEYHSNNYIFRCPPKKSKNSSLRNLTITDEDNHVYLDIRSKNPKELLLDGKWWEVLVAKSVYDLNCNYRIWQNVKFKSIKNTFSSDDKNEVDILVNIGNTLLFIECKTGKFDQNNIYKLRAVKDTYGGEKSKAVLVSSHPVDPKSDLWDKAKELRVDIIAPSPKKGDANDEFLTKTLLSKLKAIIESLKLM